MKAGIGRRNSLPVSEKQKYANAMLRSPKHLGGLRLPREGNTTH
jgi:hypothetical protein